MGLGAQWRAWGEEKKGTEREIQLTLLSNPGLGGGGEGEKKKTVRGPGFLLHPILEAKFKGGGKKKEGGGGGRKGNRRFSTHYPLEKGRKKGNSGVELFSFLHSIILGSQRGKGKEGKK